jgi:hypothetical protein
MAKVIPTGICGYTRAGRGYHAHGLQIALRHRGSVGNVGVVLRDANLGRLDNVAARECEVGFTRTLGRTETDIGENDGGDIARVVGGVEFLRGRDRNAVGCARCSDTAIDSTAACSSSTHGQVGQERIATVVRQNWDK